MKLKSFGCSFVWGSEMRDAELNPRYPSKRTWPALLAQHLCWPYECYARPGAGNLQVSEKILNQIAVSDATDLFVINWTYIDRFDYANCRYPKFSPKNLSDPGWDTIRPGGGFDGQEQLAEYYFKWIHSEYRDKLTNLMQIKLCLLELEAAGIPYIMTYMDHLLFDRRWHVSPVIESIQDALAPHMLTFAGQNMVEYSKAQGYQIGEYEHPLESAHQDLFAYALDHFLVDKIKTS